MNRRFSQFRNVPDILLVMTPHRSGQVKEGPAVALVTGGAVRVGRAIALALARHGFRVAISYHRSAGAARATLAALRTGGTDAAAFRADLRSPAQAARLVARTVARFGRIDVLVNSAAVFFPTPFSTTTRAQWDALLDLNLRGAFFCAQAAARAMREGHIVNIGDAGGNRVWPGYIPYALSKAGVAALTRSLAVALAPRIAVNCVAPGAVLRPPGFPLARWRRLTGGRRDQPERVAEAVVYFARCPRAVTGRVAKTGPAEREARPRSRTAPRRRRSRPQARRAGRSGGA
jgi:NAD(P)-dependent dehydrogenase (short-subunit alcohol dehydrogenase family)